MDFTYRVLWCDDDKSWFKSIRAQACSRIETATGLRADVKYVSSVQEALDANCNLYDLFLIDFNLDELDHDNKDKQGDALIEAIREKDVFTTVIFYSANGIDALRRVIYERELDGVYVTSRANATLLPTIESVSRLSVNKRLDLHNIRGLFISGVAEVEEQMLDNLKLACTCESLLQETEIKDYFADYLKRINLQISKTLSDVNSIKKISGLLDSYNFDLNKKSMLTQSFAKKISSLDSTCEFVQLLQQEGGNYADLFKDDVSSLRNIMAHQTVAEFETELLRQMGASRESTSKIDFLIEIRKRIEKHQKLMDALKVKLEQMAN